MGSGMRLGAKPIGGALLAALLLAPVPAAAIAGGDPPPVPRPDALQQPLEDGCQRSPVGLLTFSSPEWVYVYAHESFNPNPARARRPNPRSLCSGVTAWKIAPLGPITTPIRSVGS